MYTFHDNVVVFVAVDILIAVVMVLKNFSYASTTKDIIENLSSLANYIYTSSP